MKTASRSDRKLEPHSKDFVLLKINREFSHEQMDRIKTGFHNEDHFNTSG